MFLCCYYFFFLLDLVRVDLLPLIFYMRKEEKNHFFYMRREETFAGNMQTRSTHKNECRFFFLVMLRDMRYL